MFQKPLIEADIPDIKLKKITSTEDINSTLKVEKNVKRSQYLKFSFSCPHFLKAKFPTVTMTTKALLNYVMNYSLNRSKSRTNLQHFSLWQPGTLLRWESVGATKALVTSSRLQVLLHRLLLFKDAGSYRVWKPYL